MVDRDKLKTMAELGRYDKKYGRKDAKIYAYDKDDYVRFERLKTAVLVTVAYIILVGFLALWNLDWLMNHFDRIDYKMLAVILLVSYTGIQIFYLILSGRRSRIKYEQAAARMDRYRQGLDRMKEFYAEEDRKHEQFEKGEWMNGQ